MDKIHSKKYRKTIISELTQRPDLQSKIATLHGSFIKWASIQRLYFHPNIEDEVETFLSQRRRMYETNVKKWYAIMQTVFDRDRYTCAYCGQKGGNLEVDHVIPFSKGGDDTIENLVTACRRCNRQKKDKSVSEFIEWRNKHEQENIILQPR